MLTYVSVAVIGLLTAGATPSAKKECETMQAKVLKTATDRLEKTGEVVPLGAAMKPDKTVTLFDVSMDEHPSIHKALNELLENFRKLAQDKKLRASAIVYPTKPDVFEIRLDHEGGYSVVVTYPYEILPTRKVKFGTPKTKPGPADIFR